MNDSRPAVGSRSASRQNGGPRSGYARHATGRALVESLEPRLLLSAAPVNHRPTELSKTVFGRSAFQAVYANISFAEVLQATSAHDADGDPLAFLITSVPPASGHLWIIHGNVTTQVFSNTAYMVAGDTLSWLPAENVKGKVQAFSVLATDGKEFAAHATKFTIPTKAVPIISISTTNVQAWESTAGTGAHEGVVKVTRTGNLDAPLQVMIFVGGNAVLGTHFTLRGPAGNITGTTAAVTIPARQKSVNLFISPINDHVVDPTRQVWVGLERHPSTTAPAYGVSIGAWSAGVNIIDGSPTISIAPVAAGITEGGTNQPAFVLTRTAAPGGSLAGVQDTVNLNYTGGTFASARLISPPASVIFGSGETSKSVLLTTLDDAIAAAAKTIKATISGTGFGIAGSTTATVNVADGSPTLSLTTPVATTTEAAPSTPGEFLIARTGNVGFPLTVNFTLPTGAGIGTRDVDFVLTAAGGSHILGNSFTIPAGAASTPVFVVPVENGVNSALKVSFTLAANGTLFTIPAGAAATGTVTITNNNLVPLVSRTSVSRFGAFNQSTATGFNDLVALMGARLATGSFAGVLQLKVASISVGTLQILKSGQSTPAAAAANALISAGDVLVWTPPALTHMGNQLAFTLSAVEGTVTSATSTQFLFTIL